MSFEEAIVEILQRNSAVVSNSVYGIKSELKEINRTLQFIGIQLKQMNERMSGIEKSEEK